MSRRGAIRVLIAEDDKSVREAVEVLVRTERRFELAASVPDAESAVDAARREQPDVALIDVRMPGGGASAARGIGICSPGTRILAFTVHDDRESVLEMLEAGAVGYLLKGDSIDEIVDAIKSAYAGQSPLSAGVTGDLIDEVRAQLRVNRQAETQTRRLETRIRRALNGENNFSMVFQPIFSLAGPTVGAEALARFQGPPKRGPDRWFAEADKVGLRRELELATMKAALSELPSLPPEAYLSVNASPKTLLSSGFRKLIERSDPTRVVIEVTEHAEVDDYKRLNTAFDRVRALGVRLAVDDAGAGFASLRHILRLAPDFIKLDRTLIDGIETDRSRQALAAGLISFAERIDATIVAEGIEHLAELDMLTSLGVGHGQGFFLARPGPLPLPVSIESRPARYSRALASSRSGRDSRTRSSSRQERETA